ncbi:MAG: glutathione S-transferase C-terminal domain-containing protein [Polyangiaceae bacterium]
MDLSPFVAKLLTWLRMTGVEHRTAIGDVRKAPSRKLPYIDEDGRLLGDSSLIIEHLLATARAKPLPGDALTATDAAIAAAFKGMLESELYFVILFSRWAEDYGFSRYKPVLVKSVASMGVPSVLAPLVVRMLRRQMISQTYQQGMGRHASRVVLDKGKNHLDALAVHLADKPFFMGAEHGTIDATLFGFLDCIFGTPLCPTLTDHARTTKTWSATTRRSAPAGGPISCRSAPRESDLEMWGGCPSQQTPALGGIYKGLRPSYPPRKMNPPLQRDLTRKMRRNGELLKSLTVSRRDRSPYGVEIPFLLFLMTERSLP